jgi:hypothetical protein
MKMKIFSGLALVAMMGLSVSCKKDNSDAMPATESGNSERTQAPAAALCATKYLNLVVDPSTGGSFLYKIENSPSNPVVVVDPINGSLGNNQIGSVTRMTGLSYDPVSGVCFGVTGNAGSNPNSIVKFALSDPNVVSIAGILSTSPLNLSDIEKNPFNGRYYAINRATNRLAVIDLATLTSTDLPGALPVQMRGLAMDPGGKIYLLRTVGASGNIYVANPGTGGIILGPCAYPGAISPGVFFNNAEAGLHFDDVCTNRLVTGNAAGNNFQLTDGLPTCLGGPLYTALPNSIKPTVDFARLN